MTTYELIKDITSKYGTSSLVSAGLLSYIVPRHVEIFEAIEALSKDKTKEEAIKEVCQRFTIKRTQVFLIQSRMLKEVSFTSLKER